MSSVQPCQYSVLHTEGKISVTEDCGVEISAQTKEKNKKTTPKHVTIGREQQKRVTFEEIKRNAPARV